MNLDSNSLKDVAPLSLRTYLERHRSWKETAKLKSGAGTYYEAPNSKDPVLVLGLNTFADYSVRMAENIAILARYEQRDPDYVLQELLAAKDDLIRIRLHTPPSDNSLRLSEGSALFSEARNLILAAARAAEYPQRSYSTKPSKQVKNYIDRVRFGHTEQGSFILPIYSPVTSDLLTQSPRPTDDPLPRRVTKTLVVALAATRSEVLLPSTQERTPDLEDQVAQGVSANLCSSISSLIGLSGGVDFSVSWALALPTSQNDFEIQFKSQDLPRLKELGQALIYHEETVQISGIVSGLYRPPP